MNLLDNSLIISIIVIIISMFTIFLFGTKILYSNRQDTSFAKYFKYIPILGIVSLILVIASFNIYYNKKGQSNVDNFNTIKDSLNYYYNYIDTIQLTSNDSLENDSLVYLENLYIPLRTNQSRLEILLEESEKQKYTTGKTDIEVDSLKKLIYMNKHNLEILERK